jgi:membrane-associated protease RseP (regulator of RpoE activity)
MAMRTGLFLLVGLAAVTAPVQAQRWESALDERGWIGISFEVEADRWGRANSILVTDVMSGSPAEEAGVRPGDRLLAVNGLDSPTELEQLAERLRLRVGDRVVMEIERAGERRRLQLQAAERPDDVHLGRRIEVAYSEGDQVEAWVRSMDSLRVEIVREGGGTVQVRATSGPRPGRLTVVGADGPGSVRAPFEFFVFRGEAHDSLRQEMTELNHTVEELRQRVAERSAELARHGTRDASGLVRDEEVRRLSRMIDQAALRSAALEAAMAEDARRTAGLEYIVRSPAPTAPLAPDADAKAEAFRPLTPYILGRNRVAGAEVVDLRPELAEYFTVEGGVLVVDVAPGTPAALAGLVPGDVITRIDQVGVRSVEDLRFGVSMAEDGVPLTLIRKGGSVQVLLRR